MRRLNAVLSIAVMLAFAASLGGYPAKAYADHPNPIREALQNGGDRLVGLQNADGGWFFDVADPDCGLGPGVSCPNTFGVTALGLVDSFRVTHDPAHRDAATAAGDVLVAKHLASPACDANPLTSGDRPFTIDVVFLLDGIGRLPGHEKKAYRAVARDWFECVMEDFPNAADRADNRINGRIAQGLNNLGAWDAGLDIRAAIAVGKRAYGRDETLEVIAREADWDVADPDCPGCELLSKGVLLLATDEINGDPTIRAARASWRDDLLAAQLPDGSWGGDTQITAYVVMGLAVVPQKPNVQEALKNAVDFLLAQQFLNGGFAVGVSSTDEVTEVDGEVLQALAAARGRN